MDWEDLEAVIERVKGVMCICSSLAVSAEAGKHKYSGDEMAVLSTVLDGVIFDLEKLKKKRGGGLTA